MKITQLSDDDVKLLEAAHAICKDAEAALDKAHKASQAAESDYQALLKQLSSKHEIVNAYPSDDLIYIYGQPLKLVDTDTEKG